MTRFLSKWYGAFLLSSLFLALSVFSLLPTGQAFAHASREKHASRTSLSQRPADDDGCRFEDCNGEKPEKQGCTDLTQLQRVSQADIAGPTGVIGQVSILKSADCAAYFAEVDSYVGAHPETVSIQRNAGQDDELSYASGPDHTVGLLSRMVGIGRKGQSIRATGQIKYGQFYSGTTQI